MAAVKSRFVAAMIRKSVGMTRLPPTRSNVRSWRLEAKQAAFPREDLRFHPERSCHRAPTQNGVQVANFEIVSHGAVVQLIRFSLGGRVFRWGKCRISEVLRSSGTNILSLTVGVVSPTTSLGDSALSFSAQTAKRCSDDGRSCQRCQREESSPSSGLIVKRTWPSAK